MKPQLAAYFQKATNEVFGVSISVTKDSFKKFSVVETDLLKQNIYPKDFAYGVLRYLQSWTLNKGWTRMPINIFCGPWVRDLYVTDIRGVDFVDTPEDDMIEGLLLHDELMVARYSIATGKTFREAVSELSPVLSEGWMEAYTKHRRIKIQDRALEVLSMEAGEIIESYDELT